MIEKRTCYACELSLTAACAQSVPVVLCGLCKLLSPDQLHAYFERWNRRIGDLRAGGETCCSRCS